MIRSILTRALAALLFALASLAAPVAAAQGRADFDHLATGYPLNGSHANTPCESCHVRGIFKGTPRACEACHQVGTRVSALGMPPSHPPTTQGCALCHNTVTFSGARFNHVGVPPGTCTSCHNGSTAKGKPSGHLVTSQMCDVCHRTTGWTPATFSHGGVAAGTCATCWGPSHTN